MLTRIKSWLNGFSLPKDANFKQRTVARQKLGNWLLVELGANDYVLIHDMLAKIQLSDQDEADKNRELIGLRYMALAMSLRTRSGRIPLDWQNQDDLMHLANLPNSRVIPALDAIAILSGIDWITPSYQPQSIDEAEQQDVDPPTQEEIAENPS
ncbi:hypothetical protein GCM10011369_23440 [Neiella marina]|uniref:Uncharacterized protein n=1 Tax=Neiella marina TaxID=508461 RepID=A0A8J2XPK1_9GAMM|nr:hypothetical protein [Neiella marina]GGA80789.1 hypothetical protein GCM10011369_23440 [Neiella marina]